MTIPRHSVRVAAAWLIVLANLSAIVRADDTAPKNDSPRQQLAIGYSLLYQEAKAIPKLKWLLAFKNKNSDMTQLTTDLLHYYEELTDSLDKLATRYPAVHLDLATMPEIESDARKAMGEDRAKDMVPLIGKSGKPFERDTLLLLADALDEQRHLVGVMIDKESEPGLNRFLVSTKGQLDTRYQKIRTLLERRYFAR